MDLGGRFNDDASVAKFPEPALRSPQHDKTTQVTILPSTSQRHNTLSFFHRSCLFALIPVQKSTFHFHSRAFQRFPSASLNSDLPFTHHALSVTQPPRSDRADGRPSRTLFAFEEPGCIFSKRSAATASFNLGTTSVSAILASTPFGFGNHEP